MKCLDPLRGKKLFIRKAEDGPCLGFGYKSLISDPLRSDKGAKGKHNLHNLTLLKIGQDQLSIII